MFRASSEGLLNYKEQMHRHLYDLYENNSTPGCLNEIEGNILTAGSELKQNECMYSSDRNSRVLLINNHLITQEKTIDDDGPGSGQTLYQDVHRINLN